MKFKAQILELSDLGERVVVKVQYPIGAEWRGHATVELAVPDHTGRRYRIGQQITIEVKT